MTPIWRQSQEGAEYGIDLAYISRKAACCGCHPDTHDQVVGCMGCLCKCQEGTVERSSQPVFVVELPLLLGIQGTIIEQLLERHQIRSKGAGEERHLSVKQFRKLLKLVIVTYGLRQIPLHNSRAAHNRGKRRHRRKVAPVADTL